MRDRDRPALVIAGVKHRKCRMAVDIDGARLRIAERPGDVPLPERPAGPRREHEVSRADERRSASVRNEDRCQQSRDRHRPRRPVGLRRRELPATIDLEGELDLSFIEVVEAEVAPSEREQLGEPRAGQRRQREQRVLYGSGAAAIVRSSSAPPKTRRRWPLDGFGRSEESSSETGLVPDHASRRAAYR